MNIEDYKKRNSFTTPEGYFEQLSIEIKEATCKGTASSSKRRNPMKGFISIMSYAAMIAIIVTVATSIFFKTYSNDKSVHIASIDDFDDIDFIDNMLTSYPIDEYTFYCYLTGNE